MVPVQVKIAFMDNLQLWSKILMKQRQFVEWHGGLVMVFSMKRHIPRQPSNQQVRHC
ncbi:uncharacterized protein METZ01_LOCUS107893, partial [marine metagenome]